MRQQLQGRFTAGALRLDGFAPIPEGTARQLRVRVAGDAVRGVVAGDTWAGWVDAIALDGRGDPLVWDNALQLVRYHGRVEAVLVDATFDDIDLLTRRGLALG